MPARLCLAGMLAAACLLVGCSDAQEPQAQASSASPAAVPQGSGFDFYVLALSWSPSYCAAEGDEANRQQCGAKRPYAFVVHGLWPQFERGYPDTCATAEASVPDKKLRTLYDIMPSAGLIRHQWKKHGSCAGLGQDDYFAVLRAAREAVEIPDRFAGLEAPLAIDPDEVETSFIEANPELPADGVAVTCDRKYLREVRLCMTRQLAFRACPEVDRRACHAASVTMPPTRGG